ncbi:hypothetical protein H6P81_016281 [Aristolochia fimbriata]|uniref:Reverse transcriptase domain-containing protein n=1 Tax=Aristolochia fimbriata TaxID=158543 RepID=A0AAV7EAS5_ARIFI|nr:hypothetical protein H6P81_016281 [Aristolochia fimbriata]
MAKGTRFKMLDESVKTVQSSQLQLQKEVEGIQSTLSGQQKMFQELLSRLSALHSQFDEMKQGTKPTVTGSDYSVGLGQIGRHKPAPVELNRFDGQKPEAWVFAAERYFDIYKIPDESRVDLASFYFEGEATEWFRWMFRNKQLAGWKSFAAALIKRFRPKELEAPEGCLAKLQQISTVADYHKRFEAITNETIYLPPLFLVHCFISGLRSDIKTVVLVSKPTELDDAITLALLHEQPLALEKESYRHTLSKAPGLLPNPRIAPSTPSSSNSSNTITATNNTALSVTGKTPIRRIRPAEAQKRRAQGLCYYCDEKYTWSHNCKNLPQLLLMTEEGDPIEEPPTTVVDTSTLTEPHQIDEVQAQSAISYNAMAGGVSPNTLRFIGQIQGKPVQVLLDGGSTHNFIQSRAAKFLGLPIEVVPNFSVLVGSGDRLPCEGIVKQVPLSIQGCELKEDFYVLSLHGWDVVLGVSWLASLGPVLTDYGASTFEFTHNGQKIHWQGEQALVAREVQLHCLRRMVNTQSVAQFYRLQLLPTAAPIVMNYPEELSSILEEYADIFSKTQGLPPSRARDHAIHLIPNAHPVNVKPYRYPHFQKQEMEKLVVEMLSEGIIRPSSSPFSSPVLLVRKKDGTWRFCVDYRALNAITVRDRFPIPTIDELFDELHGAAFFSKLDLLAGYHQIRIHSDDIEKTAFREHTGHYEFLVMPFGLTNAPATFQSLMNDIFRPYLRKFVLVFFDDILVYSPTWKTHLEHLRFVFQLLRTNQLVAKQSKCVFGQTEINYLGHFINRQGLLVDPKKIGQYNNGLHLKDSRMFVGFLGLAGYYRRFIKKLCSRCWPTHRLTKERRLPMDTDYSSCL